MIQGLRRALLAAAWAAWAAGMLQCCQPLTGTETGNGTSGMVIGLLGKPVPGAQVTLVPVEYSEIGLMAAVNPVCSTRTDTKGRFTFADLPPGRYNLFCDSGANAAYRDSLEAGGRPGDTIPTVYLGRTGSVSGTALVSSGRSAPSASVAIIGSRISAAVRADDGGFGFSGLAPGTYHAKIVAPGKSFFSRTIDLRVREGQVDTIRNPFLLVSTTVTSLTTDSTGLWIGTMNGLACLRLDGTWRAFGLPDGLSSSRITCLNAGPDGALWAGTTIRLARICNDTLAENVFAAGVTALPSITNITALAGDGQGNLWVGTQQALFAYNKGNVARVTWNDALTGLGSVSSQNKLTAVSAILCLGSETVIGTLHGVYYRDSGLLWHEVPGMADLAVSAMVRGDAGAVWFGTNQGLRKWNLVTRAVTAPFAMQAAGAVTSLAAGDNDSLFIGTTDGLFAAVDSGIVAKPLGGGGVSVNALARDGAGVLWAGTNDGLVRIGRDGIQDIR